MAQRMHVTLIDDISGEEIKEGKGGELTFGLDGKNYLIDLNDKNQRALRDFLQPYVVVARPLRTGHQPAKASASRRTRIGPSPREIRDWARSNGYDVPDRGRIPGNVQDAFNAAHN